MARKFRYGQSLGSGSFCIGMIHAPSNVSRGAVNIGEIRTCAILYLLIEQWLEFQPAKEIPC